MRGRLGLSFLPSAVKPPLLFSSIWILPLPGGLIVYGSRHYDNIFTAFADFSV
jgi:hypothetical protein